MFAMSLEGSTTMMFAPYSPRVRADGHDAVRQAPPMEGSVIRQNVCHQPGKPSGRQSPALVGAHLCNMDPISRTTNGQVTNMLASTIPAARKMILKPRSCSTKPRAPADPHSKINDAHDDG